MRSFFALVQFTDLQGVHPAGSVVNLPYESDEDIANAQSMIRYGVITEQAPASSLQPNNENPVVSAPVEAQPVVLTANEENAVDPEGEPVPVEEPAAEEPDLSPSVAEDDPETPYFDARGADGSFVKEGTPVEEPAAEEAPVEEQSPVNEEPERERAFAPKKATRRKR